MLDRKVAPIVTSWGIEGYFIYSLSHCFNSYAEFMNSCLNNFWAKGAKMINNLSGVLLRFRENKTVINGDIRKMYHAVKITIQDQHTHRFLWRNLETNREPDMFWHPCHLETSQQEISQWQHSIKLQRCGSRCIQER